MSNNSFLIMLLTVVVSVVSCNNSNVNYSQSNHSETKKVEELIPSFFYDSSYLMVVGDSNKKYHIVFENDDKSFVFETKSNAFTPIDTKSLIKKNTDKDNANPIAYKIYEDSCITLKVRIPSFAVDTAITINYDVKDIINANTNIPKAKIISGVAAVLQNVEDDKATKTEVRRWLYQHQLNLSDDEITELTSIKNFLLRTDYCEYTTNGDIPVITSFANKSYDINTDMEADYYYLFACKNDREIETFVEDMVSLDFEGASNNCRKMNCYRTKGEGGTLCIFLIGINKDWSKSISPIGIVTIDNVNPTISSDKDTYGDNHINNNEESDIKFVFNNMKSVIWVHNIQPIRGNIHISTDNFNGFKVPFTFDFSGDIKNISIKRESDFDFGSFKNETKTIELYGKESPVHFSYKLDLGIGDNKIPIKVTDIRGNSSEIQYSIKMVYRESSSPEINIENHIDIYN